MINISRIFAHTFCSCFYQLIYLLTQNQNVMKTILLALLMLPSIAFFAQKTDNYLVTHKVRKATLLSDVNLDTMANNPDGQLLKTALKQLFQSYDQYSELLELKLYCNANESLFVLKDALETETNDFAKMGYQIALGSIGMTIDSKMYKNTLKKKSITQKTERETLYKINHPYRTYDWKITDSSKVILGHSCFKATALLESEHGSKEPNSKTIITWFTKDIPLPFGPSDFNGLPGLVLEASDPKGNGFYATTIEEHYVDKSKILQEPKGGKEISEAAFEAMEAAERAKREKEQGKDD